MPDESFLSLLAHGVRWLILMVEVAGAILCLTQLRISSRLLIAAGGFALLAFIDFVVKIEQFLERTRFMQDLKPWLHDLFWLTISVGNLFAVAALALGVWLTAVDVSSRLNLPADPTRFN